MMSDRGEVILFVTQTSYAQHLANLKAEGEGSNAESDPGEPNDTPEVQVAEGEQMDCEAAVEVPDEDDGSENTLVSVYFCWVGVRGFQMAIQARCGKKYSALSVFEAVRSLKKFPTGRGQSLHLIYYFQASNGSGTLMTTADMIMRWSLSLATFCGTTQMRSRRNAMQLSERKHFWS
jgi:hypothetical protein